MTFESLFPTGRWIWSATSRNNHFVLFAKSLPAEPGEMANIRLAGSYNFELWVNGVFLGRGPIHGDNQWCHYEEYTYVLGLEESSLDIAVLVHHSTGTLLGYQLPGAAGMIAEIEIGSHRSGTDDSWKYLDLNMWRDGVPQRGWALDYHEDYDAQLEPPGWEGKRWGTGVTAHWPSAVLADASQWGGYSPRRQPPLLHEIQRPHSFWTWRAEGPAPAKVEEISPLSDAEELIPVEDEAMFCTEIVNEYLWEANAITFDLGKEWVGHYYLDIEAPAGITLEISGAELLRDGRPWIFRKGTHYSARYVTREGRQSFRSFFYSGCRYLHLVVRGSTDTLKIHNIGLQKRQPALVWHGHVKTGDAELQDILEMCRHTVEIGTQEHLIDCPTREQTQYWGDGLFVAQTLWLGWGERSYLEYFFDSYLHVPLREDGNISAKYPGAGQVLLDYSLIPVLGQPWYKQHTGSYYKPEETLAKALQVKQWYDRHLDDRGLVSFNFNEYFGQGVINFIDHCGIGWHNFPHPGIDRDGTSAPLNLFFYGHLKALAELAAHTGHPEAEFLKFNARKLGQTILATFFREGVFHDAEKDGKLTVGTSWQTNSLAVLFELIQDREAKELMRTMLDGYDRLCRCSPYFHYYFLPAMRKAGLEKEAIQLIKREWGYMMSHGATSAWEGFLGDEKDSLCHPWSTAPLLFVLDS